MKNPLIWKPYLNPRNITLLKWIRKSCILSTCIFILSDVTFILLFVFLTCQDSKVNLNANYKADN